MNPTDSTKPIHHLNYESRRRSWRTCITDWIARRSYWVITLAIVLPAWAVSQFDLMERVYKLIPYQRVWWLGEYLLFAAVFLPAAIRQSNWRKGLVLAVVAGGVYALDHTVWDRAAPAYPFCFLIWYAPLIGVCQWALNPPHQPRTLVWTLALTAAVAFVVPSITVPVRYMHWITTVPIGGGWHTEADPAFLLHWSLLALLTWLAIPAAQRLSATRRRAARWLALLSIGACVAWFVLFFEVIVCPLAAHSLVRGWPFDRNYAISILEARKVAKIDELLWQTVESADWAQQPKDLEFEDYRKRCITALSQRDRPATAQRLSAMLRRKPSMLLAEYAAPFLAQEHHYEATPELMRYALLDGSQCTSALEAMGIPQSAWAILREEANARDFIYGLPESPNARVEIYEQELAKVLGKDVGPRWGDWLDYCTRVVDQLPTPLSAEQVRETNRVMIAMGSYYTTAGRLKRAGRLERVPKPNLNVVGTAALEQEMQKYQAAAFPPAATEPSTSQSSRK